MKISNFTIALSLLSIIASAQPPKGKATPGTVYGASVGKDNVRSVQELAEGLKTKDTVDMKVRVKVEDVCAAKGCWFTFKTADGQTATVKMKDYAFFVPMDLKGKTAVIDGNSFIRVTSVEDQKHYAEDAKKSKTEIDAITEPKKELRFVARGILVE